VNSHNVAPPTTSPCCSHRRQTGTQTHCGPESARPGEPGGPAARRSGLRPGCCPVVAPAETSSGRTIGGPLWGSPAISGKFQGRSGLTAVRTPRNGLSDLSVTCRTCMVNRQTPVGDS
jgi:hypothetical protein